MARVGIFLIIIALIGGTIGCALPSLAQYDLTISSTEGGLVTTPGEGTGSFTYDEGKVVDLVATPDEYYRFVKWTGDVGTVANVSSASTTITMNGDYEITANFEETAPITFAVVGSMTEFHGQDQRDGASMAVEEINDAGGVDISGVKYTVELVEVETKEETEGEDGSTGTANLEAVINDVDFIVGGSRREVVSVYREVAMDAHKIFMNCGAATGSLQFSVVTDYDRYKYWFKVTPYNEVFLVTSLYKITQTIGGVLRQTLEGYGEAVAEDYRVPEDGKLRVAILMEDAAWCAQMVTSAQSYLPSYGFTVVGTWLVSPTASDISTELSQIAAVKPHIIFTAFSGPVSVTYSSQRVELGIPAMTIGINVLGELKSHWESTDGKCNGEIMLDTWAEGLQYTAKTTAFFDTFMAKTGEYPIWTAATYDAIYSLKVAIEATDSLDADDIIPYLETHPYTTGAGGPYAYYPMPAIDLGDGVYALSEAQVRALHPGLPTYNQAGWLCAASGGPHIAHDLVYGPGYATGIGSQWQGGHKVGIWPIDLGDAYDAALTDQYGCWNFEYPGTVDVVIPIEGFLAS
jgi:branched-chain amino acid transport system substrate-binding protein